MVSEEEVFIMINWGYTFRYAYGDDCPPSKEEKRISLKCPYCGVHTDSEIISRFVTERSDFVRLPTSDMMVHNFFLRCTKCKSAILLLWSYGEESRDQGQTAGRRIFPFYTEAFEAKELEKDVVPGAILEDVIQAELSYYVGADFGAGLLLRRACQNICRDKKCEEDGLPKQIKDLVNKKIITEDMAEWADTIRIIGNELAHPNPRKPFVITPNDVREGREFLKQLIKVIYINPYKAKALKKKLKKKGVK